MTLALSEKNKRIHFLFIYFRLHTMETPDNTPSTSPNAVVDSLLSKLETEETPDKEMRGLILETAFQSYPEGFSPARRLRPETRDAIVASVEERREEFNGKATAVLAELHAFRLDVY